MDSDIKETEISDDADADLDFYPDDITPDMFDQVMTCMQVLTDHIEDEIAQHNQTKSECLKANKEIKKLETSLIQTHDINKDLKRQISSLQKKNLVRKLERREKEIQDAKEIQKLQQKIQQLQNKVFLLQQEKKRKNDSRRHFKQSYERDMAVTKELKKHVKQLESENEDLQCRLNEIMDDAEISTFENGHYTSDIRLTCFELLSGGVSSRNVSDIIRLVLRDVAKMEVGRLPRPTLIRYLCNFV